MACDTPSDINEHLPTLAALVPAGGHVTEMGVRRGVSTVAWLYGGPAAYVGYDVNAAPPRLRELAALEGIQYEHRVASTLEVRPTEPTDILFIDTLHTYSQLRYELGIHGRSARRNIVLHDTATYGNHDEGGGGRGLRPAIADWLAWNPEWFIAADYPNNNGLAVLERRADDA